MNSKRRLKKNKRIIIRPERIGMNSVEDKITNYSYNCESLHCRVE